VLDYGQKQDKEILSAGKITKSVKTEYSIIKINMPWFSDSLASKRKVIPVHKHLPITVPSIYVLGENTIFLSYALSYAQSIFIGVNSVDFSNDCMLEFIEAYNKGLKALKTKMIVQ
jgi:7-cyano-7-deazaguanine synthase